MKEGRLHLDSFSIIPQSFFVTAISDTAYSIDYVNATISWKRKPNLDSVYVTYRSFPYKLNAVVKRLNYDSVENKFLVNPTVFNTPYDHGSDNFFNFGNLTYNGSFGRAISFGNSQDAVVTSNLNLQLSGYLADSIEILAAITDNNLPVQPDGTTAELSDFDKIYLQFKKKNWALSLGDLDLRQNQQYFLSFYKRLQGAAFETTSRISSSLTNKATISGAVSKGKYTRNIFQGLEGNQGPYRLQGANNELYFFVLAGTEKIYIDGQLLQRGEDQDYTINYNTAEITFTPRRLITKDSRIQAEFEYSNQSYLNVNLYFADELNIGSKLKLKMGVYSNSDSRNSPINQTLNADQKKFLNLIGDSINKAYYPYSSVDTLTQGKILYQKEDTVYQAANGLYYHDSIYVYSVNPAVTLYNLSFTNVGQGNGNYAASLNGINGSVFQWIAPVNGQKQGQYEAAEFLVTPKTQQVYSVGADYAITHNTVVSGEFAASHYDVNTLSTQGKSNDNGYATRFQLNNLHPFLRSAKGLQLQSRLYYEYDNINFQPIERLRPVEFYRDWGLPYQMPAANETLYSGSTQLIDAKKNTVKYEISGYNREAQFQGIRNSIIHSQDFGGWILNDQVSLTNGNSPTDKGYFFRPTIDLAKTLKKFKNYTIGINLAVEHNESRNKATDTVSSSSYAFQTMKVYLKSPERNLNHWGASFYTRDNSYPLGNELVKGDHSDNLNVYAELNASRHHQFRINATYRNLQIINTKATSQQPDKTLLGRFEYLINEWKGMVTGNLLYEVGSGQEQKKSYSYLQVPAGTGQYAWIDYNNDGIQQLNEFVLAQFPDQAKFIRIFTPTNEYIKANYNTFNYSFLINPKALVGPSAKGFDRFLSRMSFQSSLQLNQKQQADGLLQLNPFQAPLNDTALITRAMAFLNTFSFNRSESKWGFDINNSRNTSKSLLTYGYQTQVLNEWNLRGRWSLSRSILLNLTFRKGISQSISNSKDFTNSNYSLDQYSIAPDLSYTRKSNLRITIGYIYADKKNDPQYGGETYSSQSINSTVKYNILQNTSIQANFTYTGIKYDAQNSDQLNSTVSYVILNGLLPGKNYLWNLDFTKKLGNNLEVNLQYEGRQPGEGHVIHTGRASIRAIL
ncbi:MAG: hypothetical protein ACHQEM_01235 [Chitinophagales bacterium]